MQSVFINLSNHHSSKWGLIQIGAAIELGDRIVDIPFPNVPPNASTEEVDKMAGEIIVKIIRIIIDLDDIEVYVNPIIHIMGEQTLCYSLIDKIRRVNPDMLRSWDQNLSLNFKLPLWVWKVVASTTERITVEKEDGTKVSESNFVQFREYYI